MDLTCVGICPTQGQLWAKSGEGRGRDRNRWRERGVRRERGGERERERRDKREKDLKGKREELEREIERGRYR